MHRQITGRNGGTTSDRPTVDVSTDQGQRLPNKRLQPTGAAANGSASG